MQAIGARQNCPCRVDLPLEVHPTHSRMFPEYCQCGGPWIVVEDWTDIPAGTDASDRIWIIDLSPRRRGHAVEVDGLEHVHQLITVRAHCRRTALPLPWEGWSQYAAQHSEERGGC